MSAFNEWELSVQTREGLKNAGFKVPTTIQKLSIGPALRGLDVVGAAKTGSGKTLAYLIPVLEKLKKLDWKRECGTGALIVTPTRELCAQIFFVLKKVGRRHNFSAGAAFGGTTATAQKNERKTISRAQILIATPGRLLEHLEAGHLNLDNLQLLVIDEADKLLEMGFKEQIDLLITYFPPHRQTLLFSATQTRSTEDLSRVLKQDKPFYAQTEVVDKKKLDHFAMPTGLIQFYVVTPLQEKINVMWTFIKLKEDKKTIVFLDTCKQVRFVCETFRQLKSRVTVLQLHGKMKQHHRLEAYHTFQRKHSVVLFATDVAARGLDFPDVDWVLQVDAPMDAKTYVHRVGRTARYNKNGQAVTLVHPEEEESFVKKLKEKGIEIQQLKLREDSIYNAGCKLPAKITANKNDIKGMAERAVVAYLRQFCLFRPHSDSGYKPRELDVDAFAHSYGLPSVPVLSKKLYRILGRSTNMKKSSEKAELFVAKDDAEVSDMESESEMPTLPSKKVKTKVKVAKQTLKKAARVGIQLHSHVKFNEQFSDGNEDDSDLEERLDLNKESKRLQEEEEKDRKAFKNVLLERKREEKKKMKLRKLEAEDAKKKARRKWLGLPNEEEMPASDLSEEELEDAEVESVKHSQDSGEIDAALNYLHGSDGSEHDFDDTVDEKQHSRKAETENVVLEKKRKRKRTHEHSPKKSKKKVKLSELESMALEINS